MGPNVLDITPHLPERPPLDVELPLQIITRLLQVGQISRHAHGIGALVLSRMQEEDAYSCILTRQDLCDAAIMVDGEPLVKINNPEIHELAWALHALQSSCGIWNHIQEHRVGMGKVRYNHFTEKHRGEGDYEALYKIIKHDTPIFFAWLPEHAEALVEDVRQNIAHGLQIARWSNIRTVKFGG